MYIDATIFVKREKTNIHVRVVCDEGARVNSRCDVVDSIAQTTCVTYVSSQGLHSESHDNTSSIETEHNYSVNGCAAGQK